MDVLTLEVKKFCHQSPSETVPNPRRTETLPTLLRKPNNAHITCLFLEQKGHWEVSCLATVSVIERRLQPKLFLRSVCRMTMAEENRISCSKICLIDCLSSTNPTLTGLGFNSSLRVDRPASNPLQKSELILVTLTIRAQWCSGAIVTTKIEEFLDKLGL